jgi:nucleoid-associated protein Lsr2
MAKQTTVTVTDDLDGSANAKEVTFSLDGESWTIDLSAKNRNALEKALKPYIAKATKQGRRRSVAASRRTAARVNGQFVVPAGGRVEVPTLRG